MNQKITLLGYYNYTVILTYIGMIAGFNGILRASDGKLPDAVICLMIAGFCDMFDGAIASTRKRTDDEKCFGIQIDSLSDLICFGVLPAVTVWSLNRESYVFMAIGSLYALCALIRLAYFNVDEQNRQKNCSGGREIYYGLPVTLSALFLPVVYAGSELLSLNEQMTLPAVLLVMSILFLLPFKLRKPHIAGKAAILLCGIAEIILVMRSVGVML